MSGNITKRIGSYCAMALVLVLVCLAASGSRAAEMFDVKHSLGVTTVPVGPRRVVTFDLSILDSMDALGIEDVVLAAPKQNMPPYLAKYNSDLVVDAGGMRDPNLERIYEFQPDVIFISGRQNDYYDKLSRIAPTVCSNVDFTDYLASFTKNMAMLGKMFRHEERAAEQVEAILAKAEATAEKAKASGKTALVVMVNDGNISTYGPGSRFGIIHDVLMVSPADTGIRSSIHGQSVDFEYIGRINPDMVFVINRNVAIGNRPASNVLDNEIVRNTTAGRTGKMIHLDSTIWYTSGAGLASLAIMIDEIFQALD